MTKVNIRELRTGMVLARDVEDDSGYKLLGKGTALTAAQIASLDGWKVIDVWVDEEKPAKESGKGAARETRREPSALEEARKRLRARFEGRLTNQWMKSLLAEAEARLSAPRFWRGGR